MVFVYVADEMVLLWSILARSQNCRRGRDAYPPPLNVRSCHCPFLKPIPVILIILREALAGATLPRFRGQSMHGIAVCGSKAIEVGLRQSCWLRCATVANAYDLSPSTSQSRCSLASPIGVSSVALLPKHTEGNAYRDIFTLLIRCLINSLSLTRK